MMVKVERSFPAPESLAIESKKANGLYNRMDVTERLKKDFHDKCYICEIKGLQDPVVEHLLPHKNGQFPERKFDWNNLFWCCGHCNSVKNNSKYDNGIIDCCQQNPEELLRFSFREDDIKVSALNPNDERSVITATLIYETFNLRNTGIREAASQTRINSLLETMNVLYRELEKYKKDPFSRRNKKMLSALLRRDSAFAAFKRGYVRDRLSDYPGIIELVQVG